ncbi:MAG: hypothetical protein ACLTDR_00680 [Adlercreutzia equolifaciens]
MSRTYLHRRAWWPACGLDPNGGRRGPAAPAQSEIAARIRARRRHGSHAEGRRLDGLSLAVERSGVPAVVPRADAPVRRRGAGLADDLSDRLGRALPAALTEDRIDRASSARLWDACCPGCSRRPARQWARPRVGSGYLGEHWRRPRQRLEGARGRLERAGAAMTDPYRASVAVSAARLHDLSPLAIIGRGYAMAKGEDGR